MRYVGIDYGRRRIGVALSDASGTIARPLQAIERRGTDEEAARGVVAAVGRAIGEDEPVEAYVVGLPSHLDGTPHDEARAVRAFAAVLEAQAGVPVVLQDERLTSREAESLLAVRERDWRKRKARLDAASAAVFLQDFLDSRR